MLEQGKKQAFKVPDLNIQERRCTLDSHNRSVIVALKITDILEYQCLYCIKEDEAKKKSQNQPQVQRISIIDVGKLLMNKYEEIKKYRAKVIQKQFTFIKDVQQKLSDITKLFYERMDQFQEAIQTQFQLHKAYEAVLEDPTQYYFYDKNIQRDLLVFDSNKMYNYHDDSMKIWLQQIRIKIDQYYSQLQSTFQLYLPKQQNDKVINPPNQLAKSDIIVMKNLFALNLAREAYLQQDYKKGLNILEKFDQTDKQTKFLLLALYLQGKLCFQMKNYDESIINFQKIISLDDKFYNAYYKQAQCYYKQYLVQNQKNKEEQLREATTICLELIKINPNHIKAYLLFDIIIRQKKEPQQLRKGIELLNQVIQTNGYNYKLFKKKAYLHFLLKEYQQAIQIYEQILQKETNSKNSCYTMAILQLKTENIDSAFKYIRKALMIDKEYKKASDILGVIYINYPKTKLLMKELDIAIKYMPNNLDLKMLKLRILTDLEKHEEAEKLEFEIAKLKSKGF